MMTITPYNLGRQHGMALITVILIVAVISSIAVFINLNQQIWLRQTGNILDRAQGEDSYRSVIAVAKILLERDAAKTNRDDRQEIWASNIPVLPIESGQFAAVIHDAQGRFNLNNVIKNGQPSAEDIGLLRRLFAFHGIGSNLVDSLVDWMDADTNTRPGGAEDIEYLAGKNPYRSANQPLSDVDELRLIKGFTPEIIATLKPSVTALPTYTPINVNTAPPAVLAALFINMSASEAESLYEAIGSRPLAKASDLQDLAGNDKKLSKIALDTRTRYFIVSADVSHRRYRSKTETLIYRPDSGLPSRTVSKTRPPVAMTATAASG
jgi:general secretion pathway protein K